MKYLTLIALSLIMSACDDNGMSKAEIREETDKCHNEGGTSYADTTMLTGTVVRVDCDLSQK